MNRFGIIGRNKRNSNKLRKTLEHLGFKYSRRAQFIISLGGDGTFLYSERKTPGIPKLLIRDNNICKKCDNHEFDELFTKIMLKNFVFMEFFKLEATFRRKKYIATNDFILRNKTPTHALRFLVEIDGKESKLYIGDGVVIATTFGSTGYYYSITKQKIVNGIGLAFNNVTGKVNQKVLHENSVIKIKILRHEAHFGIDNDPKIQVARENETITIKQSKKTAKIMKVI